MRTRPRLLHSVPSLLVGAASVLLLTTAACDGPALPSVVKGEPVCESFSIGSTQMKGSLKHPVRLRVLDGDTAIATVMLGGIPAAGPPTRFLMPDSNQEYTLEWTQCADEHAPSPLAMGSVKGRGEASTHYECGDAKPYATVKFSTKKGDPSTHEVPMDPPPDSSCWGTDTTPSTVTSADAAPTASADAAPTASADAAPTASASASPSAAAPRSSAAPKP